MITINNLEKSFGKLKVLKGVNLFLEDSQVYAFLGPNGSGKTTLLKCVLGLVRANRGEIIVNGHQVKKDWTYREEIGYLPQIAHFPENLKVAELFDLVKDIRRKKVDEMELVRYFNLDAALDKKLKSLSGGMKQKVNAILALMFDPKILIMDEPSVGLDPTSHIKLKDIILERRAQGKTILLTTHILSDVEELADQVIYLMDGKILFQGSPEELMSSQKEMRIDKAIAKLSERESNQALV